MTFILALSFSVVWPAAVRHLPAPPRRCFSHSSDCSRGFEYSEAGGIWSTVLALLAGYWTMPFWFFNVKDVKVLICVDVRKPARTGGLVYA